MFNIIFLFLLFALVCGAISLLSRQDRMNNLGIAHIRSLYARRVNPPPDRNDGPTQQDREFEDRWHTLSRYDDDIRAAVDKVRPYGDGAIAELKRAYKIINDKAKLASVAEHIVEDAKAGATFAQDTADAESSGQSDDNTIHNEIDRQTGNPVFVWHGKRFFSLEAAEAARNETRRG